MKNKILVLIVSLIIVGCNDNDDKLNIVINDISSTWNRERVLEFAKGPESIAIGNVDYDFAKNLRNDLFANPKDLSLVTYFNSKGIKDKNHMERIISVSLHRRLNNKPIDLDKQLELIQQEIDYGIECETKNKLRAEKYFNEYALMDTIFVRMPIDEEYNAVEYICPESESWTQNDDEDLIIKGLVIGKGDSISTLGNFFSVKVLSLNRRDVKVLLENIEPKDEIIVDLESNILFN